MDINIWSEVATGVISTGIGGLFGWMFSRRKYNAEVKGEEVRNFDAAIDAYKKMYEDMISDLKDNLNDVKKENQELKDELAETRKQVMTLTNFVLASAIKRADGNLTEEDVDNLRKMINE